MQHSYTQSKNLRKKNPDILCLFVWPKFSSLVIYWVKKSFLVASFLHSILAIDVRLTYKECKSVPNTSSVPIYLRDHFECGRSGSSKFKESPKPCWKLSLCNSQLSSQSQLDRSQTFQTSSLDRSATYQLIVTADYKQKHTRVCNNWFSLSNTQIETYKH